jgi:chromosome segregation ATPase
MKAKTTKSKTGDVKAIRSSLLKARKELKEERAQHTELKERVTALASVSEQLLGKDQEIERTNKALKEQVEVLTKANDNAHSTITKQAEELKTSEEKRLGLIETVKQLDSKVASQTGEITDLQETVKNQFAKIAKQAERIEQLVNWSSPLGVLPEELKAPIVMETPAHAGRPG